MSSAAHTSAVFGRRVCAVLAAGSAGLHAVMLGHAPNLIATAMLAAMIVACLFCAHDLWRCGTLRAWCVVALMNLAMVAIHLPGPVHRHDGAAAGASAPPALMGVATVIALVEVSVAVAVLYYRTRGRLVTISGFPAR